MKLSCPSCGAKYSIADEKVHDRLAKIRCRKCSATIIIDGKVEPPNVYTSDTQHGAAVPDTGGDAMGGGTTDVGPGEYSVDFGDQDQRTMSVAQIIQAYNAGQITADTFVWTEGMGDWVPISQVPEISGMLNAAAAVSAPRISDAPKRASEPPRAAARTGAGRGSATDLFGGIETAGSEEDVQTSAPQPPPAAPMGGGATGARNESSVLFSLSALTASAGPPFGAPAPTASSASSPSKTSDSAAKEEDSGLIDLKALTASSGADMPASPLMATAPLGLAAPLGGVTAAPRMMISDDDIAPRQSGSKAGIFIGMGIFAAALVVGGAILASGGGEEKDKPADVPIAAATPLPTPTPTPTQTVTATPPATGTAEEPKKEEAKAPAKSTSYRRRSRSTKSAPAEQEVETKSASTPTTSDEPAPKKKPKPKVDKCNCAPSDLMCAMRCAAG